MFVSFIEGLPQTTITATCTHPTGTGGHSSNVDRFVGGW